MMMMMMSSENKEEVYMKTCYTIIDDVILIMIEAESLEAN